MPFQQSDSERAKLKVDTTPWLEAAVAVRRGAKGDLGVQVIAEGNLLQVATRLVDFSPVELRSIRVTLPDHHRAGRTFEGAALISLLSKARRAIVGAT